MNLLKVNIDKCLKQTINPHYFHQLSPDLHCLINSSFTFGDSLTLIIYTHFSSKINIALFIVLIKKISVLFIIDFFI
jgi:hypothetical protein